MAPEPVPERELNRLHARISADVAALRARWRDLTGSLRSDQIVGAAVEVFRALRALQALAAQRASSVPRRDTAPVAGPAPRPEAVPRPGTAAGGGGAPEERPGG